MKTTTCSIPDAAGSGSGLLATAASDGASIQESRQPSATAPAAVAALVKNLRRDIGVDMAGLLLSQATCPARGTARRATAPLSLPPRPLEAGRQAPTRAP